MNHNSDVVRGSRAVQPQGAVAEARPPKPRVTADERTKKAEVLHHALALLVARAHGMSVSPAATEWAIGKLDSFLAELERFVEEQDGA